MSSWKHVLSSICISWYFCMRCVSVQSWMSLWRSVLICIVYPPCDATIHTLSARWCLTFNTITKFLSLALANCNLHHCASIVITILVLTQNHDTGFLRIKFIVYLYIHQPYLSQSSSWFTIIILWILICIVYPPYVAKTLTTDKNVPTTQSTDVCYHHNHNHKNHSLTKLQVVRHFGHYWGKYVSTH